MKASSAEVGRRAEQLLEAAVALDALLPASWAPDAGPDEVFLLGLARKIRQQAEILAGRAQSARKIDEVLGITDEQREAGDRPRTGKDYSKVIPFTVDDDQVLVPGRPGEKLEIGPGMAHRFKATTAAGKIVEMCEAAGVAVSRVGAGKVPDAGIEPRPAEAATTAAKRDSPAAAAEAAFDLAITRDAEIAKLARMVPPVSPAREPVSGIGGDQVPDPGIEPRTQEEVTTAGKRDSPAAAVGRMAIEVGDLRRALVKATRRSTLRGRVLEALLADLRSLLAVYERASADSFQDVRDRAEARAGRDPGVIPP